MALQHWDAKNLTKTCI